MWQSVYQELKHHNFEIIAAAQDVGGKQAADIYYADAKVTYKAIIDSSHTISSLYNFVNVPSAVWIDETGKIVRINEGTFAKDYKLYGTDDYVPALKDWVINGTQSKYVWSERQVATKIKSRSADQEKAEPAFKLGSYFHGQGNPEKAAHYWQMAQELSPNNINYFRQELSFTEEGSGGFSFLKKVVAMVFKGHDYYQPLELEAEQK